MNGHWFDSDVFHLQKVSEIRENVFFRRHGQDEKLEKIKRDQKV